MLDYAKLLEALSVVEGQLFNQNHDDVTLALAMWREFLSQPDLQARACRRAVTLPLSLWQDDLSCVSEVTKPYSDYQVVASDGSQIYPDRHMPLQACFLINIGHSYISYGPAASRAHFFSEPYIFTPQADKGYSVGGFSAEMVDFKREEMEFAALFDLALKGDEKEIVSLVDGSLIFWHLESRSPTVRDHFLGAYLVYLEYFYQHSLPIVGYISFTKSRDIIQLVRAGFCSEQDDSQLAKHGSASECPCWVLDLVIDASLMRTLLEPGERSCLFSSGARITQEYPAHLKPYFCYMNVGPEMVRLEFPAWIAANAQLVDHICAVAYDQSLKGNGYPVCLAEAHEQAVVKGADRELFYHLLAKRSMVHKLPMYSSQKSLKKRRNAV